MGRVKRFDPEEKLDIAVDAFWQNGFDASGIQELCTAMGLYPASVYGAYGDKRDLFVRALDRYMATVSRDAVQILGREASGMAAIRHYFQYIVDGIVDGKRQWGCLITNTIVELAQRDKEIAAKVALHLARLETAFAGAVARGRASGEIPETVPEEMANFLVCVVQGLNVLAKTKPPRESLEAIVSAALGSMKRPAEVPAKPN